ncbi:hypothetical protein Tco_1122568 [Tanacetum coccineum]|uniref:Uncharacterized protein n=1 Tax=Tanacetum coccineum TaxID=301880 RepID=A0ABQ5J3V6_9ASTR
MGNAIVKLVKKVKKLEGDFEKKKCSFYQTSERKTRGSREKSQDDPQFSFFWPQGWLLISYKLNASREDQMEERVNTAEGVNTGSIKVSTVSEQHYTDEDWDLIRAKIEANAELSKSMLGSDLQGEDFAKKIESRGHGSYLQLKNLSFEEVKEEFDKLVKQVESFAPINFEATKASLKRFGEELQTKTSKRLKSDEAKDDEPTKKSGKRRKQMARKRIAYRH